MNCIYVVENLNDDLIQQTEMGSYLMKVFFYLTLIKIEKQTTKHISLHGW